MLHVFSICYTSQHVYILWKFDLQCDNDLQLVYTLSVLCPSLTIKDGRVTVTGLTPGSTAIYTCDSGFELVGTGFRTCLTSGVWSGTDHVCNEGVLLALRGV